MASCTFPKRLLLLFVNPGYFGWQVGRGKDEEQKQQPTLHLSLSFYHEMTSINISSFLSFFVNHLTGTTAKFLSGQSHMLVWSTWPIFLFWNSLLDQLCWSLKQKILFKIISRRSLQILYKTFYVFPFKLVHNEEPGVSGRSSALQTGAPSFNSWHHKLVVSNMKDTFLRFRKATASQSRQY